MLDYDEYQDLFRDDENPKYYNLKESRVSFSHGNHKRSFLGEEWYYYGETEDSYSVFKDVFVGETEDCLFVNIYKDGSLINEVPIAMDKSKVYESYPVQKLFPKPMNEWEVKETLRKHFLKQKERSTTTENIGEQPKK